MRETILVVDDSAMFRMQIGEALKGAGFTVVQAVDGVDGLSKLTATPGIRLVVCDVNMPRMSGLEMLERMPRSGSHPVVPVLLLTSQKHPALVARAQDLARRRGW